MNRRSQNERTLLSSCILGQLQMTKLLLEKKNNNKRTHKSTNKTKIEKKKKKKKNHDTSRNCIKGFSKHNYL